MLNLQTGRGPRIIVLYLLYPTGPAYDRETPLRAVRTVAARLPGSKIIVSIDNSAFHPFSAQLSENEFSIGGDNTYLEFSGWQRGLDFVRDRDFAGDVCLFANDTFLSQSIFHRYLVNEAALRCALKYHAMVGKRMIPPVTGDILGNPLMPYARTHLFMMPFDLIERLGSVVSLDSRSIDELMLPRYDPGIPLFRPDAPISRPIRDFVTGHLNYSWYRKKPYIAEHFEELRAKAISILNAFLLSMRVYQLGYPLISYNRARRFLDEDRTPEDILREWNDDRSRSKDDSEDTPAATNRFWQKAGFYRQLPEKMRGLTLENILDFLERRSHPEHL